MLFGSQHSSNIICCVLQKNLGTMWIEDRVFILSVLIHLSCPLENNYIQVFSVYLDGFKLFHLLKTYNLFSEKHASNGEQSAYLHFNHIYYSYLSECQYEWKWAGRTKSLFDDFSLKYIVIEKLNRVAPLVFLDFYNFKMVEFREDAEVWWNLPLFHNRSTKQASSVRFLCHCCKVTAFKRR